MMEWSMLNEILVSNVLVPLLLVLSTSLVTIASLYIKKATDSYINKNKLEALSSITSTKTNLMIELSMIVDAAVASNVQLANAFREANGGKLNDEHIYQLNQSAKNMVYNALSDDLLDENGELMNIIGGRAKLDSMVENLIEKFVIEEKVKSK